MERNERDKGMTYHCYYCGKKHDTAQSRLTCECGADLGPAITAASTHYVHYVREGHTEDPTIRKKVVSKLLQADKDEIDRKILASQLAEMDAYIDSTLQHLKKLVWVRNVYEDATRDSRTKSINYAYFKLRRILADWQEYHKEEKERSETTSVGVVDMAVQPDRNEGGEGSVSAIPELGRMHNNLEQGDSSGCRSGSD